MRDKSNCVRSMLQESSGGGDYLQNSKIFFASLGSLRNQCGQFAFHGNCVGDSALEFFPPLKQNIK